MSQEKHSLHAAEADRAFKDENSAFTFKYPADWKVDNQTAGTSATVSFTAPDDTALRFIQVIAVRGESAILITCTTTDRSFDQKRPRFDRLIKSFELPK